MPEDGGRTAEEREAARLERERRRDAANAAEGTEPAPDAEAAEPAPDAEAAKPAPDGEAEPAPEWEHEDEVASGTRRVGWRERNDAAAAVQSERPPTKSMGVATGPRRRRSLIGRLLAVLALLIAGALIWFCVELFQPFHGPGRGKVVVMIPAHSGVGQIGEELEREGVIASGFFFKLRAALAGDRGKLLAGTYTLRLDMSYSRVLTILTTPPPAANVTNVTIIPGRTRAQVDALLRSQGVHGSYRADTRHSPLLNPTAYGAPRNTPSLEGFLFPDTYQLREPIGIPALVADQLRAFKQQFATVNLAYARRRHLTPYDVLIIASMVEAEAQTARDRPLIASVIYNRLADGMPLQIDATTRYATGNYTKPLTESQLASRSPYNTRIHKGLPPTPIDSPGLASIQAAAHPASTSYLYFVVKPCGNGEHAFASSYSKFLAEVSQYYSARSARGGRSPAKC